jgi:hypothetical protein
LRKKKILNKIKEKNQRIYRKKITQIAMRENLYTTNLSPEAMREYPSSCKFTAGGNV